METVDLVRKVDVKKPLPGPQQTCAHTHTRDSGRGIEEFALRGAFATESIYMSPQRENISRHS